MKIKKYGKSSLDIWDINTSFLKEDDSLLQENLRLVEIYSSQPQRMICKNCSAQLTKILFTKQGIDYYLCENCNHLNGAYEDTDEYAKNVYLNEKTAYASYYNSENKKSYINRVKNIYTPKATFLIDCLKNEGENYKQLGYCDIGAGTGYFVYALKHEMGLNKVIGYEISKKQVDLANKMLGAPLIKCNELEELPSILKNCESDIISMIGVLEHLNEPNKALQELADNPKVRFLYLLLPLFSYNVFFEYLNQDCFNRHLSGGHTHLYTHESISYFCNKFGFDVVGEWLFGTDVVDLFRFFYIKMKKLGCTSQMQKIFTEKFSIAIIDELQEVMDRSEFCSEIHVLLRKKE